MDWRDVARERRIPVWRGAYLWYTPDDALWQRAMCLSDGTYDEDWPPCWDAAESGVAIFHADYGSSVRAFPESLVPDLADPDTRAAYDRRLALKLGAPADLVEVGAVALRRDNGEPLGKPGWRAVVTGDYWPSVDGLEIAWTSDVVAPLDADPLVARALAWPKEGS